MTSTRRFTAYFSKKEAVEILSKSRACHPFSGEVARKRGLTTVEVKNITEDIKKDEPVTEYDMGKIAIINAKRKASISNAEGTARIANIEWNVGVMRPTRRLVMLSKLRACHTYSGEVETKGKDLKMDKTITRHGAGKILNKKKSEAIIMTGSAMAVPMEKEDKAHDMKKWRKTISLQDVNPNILQLEYEIRGPVAMRAIEIEKELEKGAKKPFNKVIKANIGDAHAMGQVPITFIRQVLACVIFPDLIQSGNFPQDVKDRAQEILCACGGHSMGSYSMSYGIEMIRRDVAGYIEKRDGHKAIWQNICLCGGASNGIKKVLQLFCNQVDGKNSGILIPIPQYPLYSASLAEYGLGQVGYYLDEDKSWALDMDELARAYEEGNKTYAVRGLVIINPGNPTGQVLTRENIESIIKFAHEKKLFLFADEVYQDNVYAEGSEFFSLKKVMTELGPPYNGIELASFMSISKGYMGECGLRGGWTELCNMDPDVQANLYKAISAMLCPTTVGQVVVDCVARPPKEGEPSYDLWLKEKCDTLESLNKRSKMIVETFNKMEGFKCNLVQGAMYAFPRIELSPNAVKAAKKAKKVPDVYYAFKLLEETGICVVPGSGFGQRPGTYHFRTTILPQPDLLKEMLDIFLQFHQKFTKEYE